MSIRHLPRTVWLLGAISLLNDAASELVYPLLPLYLATVLVAGPSVLGLIEGAAEAASSLLKLASGMLYDRHGRAKPFIVAGYSIAAIARPLIALVAVWPVLLLVRVGDRIGKGLRSSPRDALLARSVDGGRRGLAFGVHRAMDNAGAVIGPLAAAALLAWQVPIRDILLWTALPGALCVALALSLREPAPLRVAASPGSAQAGTRSEATARDARPPLPAGFRRLLWAVALFTCGQASQTFLLLRATDAGMPPAQVALLWAAVATTTMLLGVPLSAWSDRVGRLRPMALGWALYALVFAGFGLATSVPMFWLLAIGVGLYQALTEGAERALIADQVPAAQLGTAYGTYYLIKGLLLLPASALFGVLWQYGAAALAFGLAAMCAVAALALLLLWVRPALAVAERRRAA